MAEDRAELGALISGLMEDDGFREIVTELKGKLGASSEPRPATASDRPQTAASEDTGGALPDFAPELLSKLPQVMGMLGAGGKGGGGRHADSVRLLEALKPFLSDKRQGAVETVVGIMGLTDIVGL